MIESLWDTLSFFKLIYGRDVIKNTTGVKKMIAEHQSYIDFLKNKDAEGLKKALSENLGERLSHDLPVISRHKTLTSLFFCRQDLDRDIEQNII